MKEILHFIHTKSVTVEHVKLILQEAGLLAPTRLTSLGLTSR